MPDFMHHSLEGYQSIEILLRDAENLIGIEILKERLLLPGLANSSQSKISSTDSFFVRLGKDFFLFLDFPIQ